jgi:carbon-monoxide dehydrogenase medium subunit
MYEFDYQRPATLSDASAIIGGDEDARLLAGGMSLLPALKFRLSRATVIADLASIPDLSGIRREGDAVVIKAMTRHAAVAASEVVGNAIPALASTAGNIGDRQVRYRGTIGGSIANNDPAADYPAASLGLGATIRTTERDIAADDFFLDIYTTALEQREIIREVSFPILERAAYIKFAQPASLFALVGVFVSRSTDGTVRVAVTGAGSCVFRVPEIEEALTREFLPERARIVVSSDGLTSDIHGDAEYRAHLIPVLAERAVRQACA